MQAFDDGTLQTKCNFRQMQKMFRLVLHSLVVLSILDCECKCCFARMDDEGTRRELRDFCDTDSQCLNSGTCITTLTQGGRVKTCSCLESFGGFRCELFCPLECHNGGTCHHVGNGHTKPSLSSQLDHNPDHYACKCLGYFMGEQCDIPYENCVDGSQCLNGGQCRESESQSHKTNSCVCTTGYSGPSCKIEGLVAPELRSAGRSFSREGRISFFTFLAVMTVGAFVASVVIHRKRHGGRKPPGLSFDQYPILYTYDPRTEERWKNVV